MEALHGLRPSRHAMVTTPRILTAASVQPFRTIALADSVRFGDASSGLPDWAKGVPNPSVTMPQYEKKRKEVEEKEKEKEKKRGIFMTLVREFMPPKEIRKLQKRLNKELMVTSKKQLPEEVKKRLKAYHRKPMTWYNLVMWKIFRSRGQYIQNRITLEGPIAIKKMQQDVSRMNQEKRPLGEFLLKLSNEMMRHPMKYYRDLGVKDMSVLQRGLYFPLLYTVAPIFNVALRRKLKEIKALEKLLGNVPALPKKEFDKPLKELLDKDEATNSSDPIDSISDKNVKSGSIAQVFTGTSKAGKKFAVKVLRPDANQEFMEKCRKYLYYRNMIRYGTEPDQKRRAAREAEASVKILLDEINLEREAENLRRRGGYVRAHCNTIEVPLPRTATRSGLITPFVGEYDLAELPYHDQQRYMRRTVRDRLFAEEMHEDLWLDIHAANDRAPKTSGEKGWMIDGGRVLRTDPAVHRALLQLKVLVFATPDLDKAYQDPKVLEALKALVNANGQADSENPYLKAITAAEAAITQNKILGTDDTEYAKTIMGVLKQLFCASDEMKNRAKSHNEADKARYDQAAKEAQDKRKDRRLGGYNACLTDLCVRPNMVEFNRHQSGLPPLTQEPITQDDMDKAWVEQSSLLQGGFAVDDPDATEDTTEAVKKKLAAMATDPETFYRFFEYPDSSKEAWKEPRLFSDNAEQFRSLDEIIANVRFKYDQSGILPEKGDPVFTSAYNCHLATQKGDATKAAQEKAAFEKNLNKLLENSPQAKLLCDAYRVNVRVRNLSQQLGEKVLTGLGMTLTPDEKQRFIRRKELAIREDLELTFAHHYLSKGRLF